MFDGERLKELRKDKKLTQKELAEVFDKKWQLISDYERGKHIPPDDMKIALAKYFDVSLDYLMCLTNEQVSYNRDNICELPKGFPKETIPKAKEYIRLLMKDAKS